MMQGDQYSIPFSISLNGKKLTGDDVGNVEICIGTLKKTLQKNEIYYDESLSAFLFPVTQEETYAMPESCLPVQVRVKTTKGEVIGGTHPGIYITDAISEEVL